MAAAFSTSGRPGSGAERRAAFGAAALSLSDADAARIEGEACRRPQDVGIPVTHWSGALLGQSVRERGIALSDNIRHSTLCLMGAYDVRNRKLFGFLDWLEEHPRWTMHFTPKHASWLNQIECAFSILQAKVLARGTFTSLDELRAALARTRSQRTTSSTPCLRCPERWFRGGSPAADEGVQGTGQHRGARQDHGGVLEANDHERPDDRS